jgi:hypothetical protein
MWEIQNNTPFAAKGAIRLHPKTCRKVWLVAIKATFTLEEDGALSVAEQQEEVLDEPVYCGDEETSSLLYDSDLFGLKEKVDILVNGRAYQPGGKADTKLTVAVGVGNWSKVVQVVGKRLWDRFLGTTSVIDPDPFVSMGITYENAYGGTDPTAKPHLQTEPRNPAGKGYAAVKSGLHGKELPNIEYPDYPTKAAPDKNRVAGLGAIPVSWKPRSDFAGTYDQSWQQTRAPFFPLDGKAEYFQSAPLDQQLDGVGGGAQVVLYHLLAKQARCSFRLPDVSFALQTAIGRSRHPHQAALRTLILEPDHPRLILVWQSAIDCQDKHQQVACTDISFNLKQS